MVQEAFISVFLTVGNCLEWFTQILDACGGVEIWSSAVLITVFFKFIFAPVFGHAKSDLAKHSYNAFKRRKE